MIALTAFAAPLGASRSARMRESGALTESARSETGVSLDGARRSL